MSLESWAIDKLSVFLGFDSETLSTQILPYLLSATTPDAFAEQLHEMLGANEGAYEFIQEFVQRRFAEKPAPPTPKPKKPVVKESTESSPSTTTSETVFPSLPSSSQPYKELWPANINVYRKSDEEYIKSLRKTRKGNKSKNNDIKSAAILPNKTPPTPAKKEKKKKNEMTLEAALKELDLKADKVGKKKRVCQCQATKHPLLSIAPNCLNCGKIICNYETVGPCSFCHEEIITKDQIIHEAKKRKEEQRLLLQSEQASQDNTSTTVPQSRYASKAGGNIYSSYADEEEKNRIKAEEHKEKLLEFQRTSAQRSVVIDQATDFQLPTDQLNPWLSPQERAILLKKQQANLKRIERAGQSKKHKVMTIDLQTKQVKVDDADSPESSSEEEEEVVQHKPVIHTAEDDKSAGTYSQNPLLKGIVRPTFIGKQKAKQTQGKLRRKERIQYEKDDILNDYMYSASIADDDTVDYVNELDTCQ
ncbi:putative zinc finger motif, C2HC5-type-domain-containing protein [Pilobolus umbonatus]|nr:putative zinc finger motif, C2HC5-type-domain-containing protein [Pilobolus umbonatus]